MIAAFSLTLSKSFCSLHFHENFALSFIPDMLLLLQLHRILYYMVLIAHGTFKVHPGHSGMIHGVTWS